jgi:hypothetical protein
LNVFTVQTPQQLLAMNSNSQSLNMTGDVKSVRPKIPLQNFSYRLLRLQPTTKKIAGRQLPAMTVLLFPNVTINTVASAEKFLKRCSPRDKNNDMQAAVS